MCVRVSGKQWHDKAHLFNRHCVNKALLFNHLPVYRARMATLVLIRCNDRSLLRQVEVEAGT